MTQLNKTLGPVMLWGLGVGYVISGMYFGWNLGLPLGGPYGFLLALVLVTLMYVTFVMSYAELACAIPKAGGAFVYGNRAFGPKLGLLAGMAQCIEFTFALPAVSTAIGAYMNLFFPEVSPTLIAVAFYAVFTGMNVWGVKLSAAFELVVTVAAVAGIIGFATLTGPHFHWEKFAANPLPNGWFGAFAALPYAIWFYLGIEGMANVAEETKDPQRDLARGFGSAMGTLVVLTLVTFFCAIGIGGWEAVVFKPGTTTTNDSPLPMALVQLVGEGHVAYRLLIGVGLLGLLASFHGLILVAGRSILEFGRMGYAPKILGEIHKTRHTPAAALIFNMLVGFVAILIGRMSEIITVSVFGALTLYIVSMLAVFRLRKTEPNLARPFHAPWFPMSTGAGLVIASLCFVSMVYYNVTLAAVYAALIAFGYGWYAIMVPQEKKNARDAAA